MSAKFIGFSLEFYIIIITINSLAKHFLLRKQEETPPFLFPPNVVLTIKTLTGRSDGSRKSDVGISNISQQSKPSLKLENQQTLISLIAGN